MSLIIISPLNEGSKVGSAFDDLSVINRSTNAGADNWVIVDASVSEVIATSVKSGFPALWHKPDIGVWTGDNGVSTFVGKGWKNLDGAKALWLDLGYCEGMAMEIAPQCGAHDGMNFYELMDRYGVAMIEHITGEI